MKNILLYMTNRSPYARKVRVTLLEKGIEFEEQSVDLAQKPEALLKANPSGTVPTLVSSNGLKFSDSTLILHYLEKTYPSPSLVPTEILSYWSAWNWEELADRLCEHNISVFFEKQRPDQRDSVFTKANTVTDEILKNLEKELMGREYICGDFSIADIAMGCAMKWITFRLGTDFKNQTQEIQNWLQRLDERPSFQKTLPRLG